MPIYADDNILVPEEMTRLFWTMIDSHNVQEVQNLLQDIPRAATVHEDLYRLERFGRSAQVMNEANDGSRTEVLVKAQKILLLRRDNDTGLNAIERAAEVLNIYPGDSSYSRDFARTYSSSSTPFGFYTAMVVHQTASIPLTELVARDYGNLRLRRVLKSADLLKARAVHAVLMGAFENSESNDNDSEEQPLLLKKRN